MDVSHASSGDGAGDGAEDFAGYTRRVCGAAALALQAVLTVDGSAFRRTVTLAGGPPPGAPGEEEVSRLLAVLALALGRLSNVQQAPLTVVIDQLTTVAGGRRV